MKIRKIKRFLFLNELIIIFSLLINIKSEEIVHDLNEIVDENYRVYIGTKEPQRPAEGISNVIKIESSENSVLLSLPKEYSNENKISVQLQLCYGDNISYSNLNANTEEEIFSGQLLKTDKFFYYLITNTSYETKVNFIGNVNDTIYLKYSHLYDYQIQEFREFNVTFDQNENMISVIKPIIDEEFNYTILIGKKGTFDSYNLCTFSELDKSQYKALGDFVVILNSVSNQTVNYYVHFESFFYNQGDEFEILVYAVQINNTKFEFLYDIISGVVGPIHNEIIEINDYIHGKEYYATQLFKQNSNNNYLFYDFTKIPAGDVASFKIKENNLGGLKIQKVVCTFLTKTSTDYDIYYHLHDAFKTDNNCCFGEINVEKNEYNGLINALDIAAGYTKFAVMIIYDNVEGEKENKNEDIVFNITLRVNGIIIDKPDYGYNEDEELTIIPYVLDLRLLGDINAILLFSNTRDMKIFYLENSGTMTKLVSGNVILLNTDLYSIYTQYKGVKIFFLIANSFLGHKEEFLDEKFIFKATFFEKADNMKYYISENLNGRALNVPIILPINSCVEPFYFIFNYNKVEESRFLHIENIFGELSTIKFSNQFNEDNWYDIIDNMKIIEGNDYYIIEQSRYHIDVVEISCKTPSLLNIYYTDPIASKKENLDISDISIIDLYPGTTQILTFKTGLSGEFFYSFNIIEQYNSPIIRALFEDGELPMTKNGIFIKKSEANYNSLILSNNNFSGTTPTKIFFKFGISLISFTKIENDIYNLQTNNRTSNLFVYIFPSGEDRLNYTKVDLTLGTTFENVKVCFSINFGFFLDPSLQNCFFVGKAYPSNFSVLNPYLMYKNYYINEEFNKLYVSLKTEDINQNITIIPTLSKYKTNYRNIEGFGNSILISNKTESTILTTVENENKYIFVQIESCTFDTNIEYEFKNAYNSSSLGEIGNIQPNTKSFYINIDNIKLDIELVLRGNNEFKAYVKHESLYDKYQPTVKDIEITYDINESILYFTQPIEGEDFNYTIFIDKFGNLLRKNYSLCSYLEMNKLSNYSIEINSKEKNNSVFLDLNKSELEGSESFDVLILAEQVNNGKLVILSDISSYDLSPDDEKEEEEEEEKKEEEEIIPDEENEENRNGKSKIFMIVGFTILGVLIFITILVVFIIKRRKKKEILFQNINNISTIEENNEKMLTDNEK